MNHPTFEAPPLETMNRLLPAFEFTALLASNALSAVYFAKQRSLDRDVAIKVLAPHVSEAAEFRSSFETTARTMARLNHPNLIRVYDSGFVERMIYFVMEFVPGKSLEHSSRGQQVEFKQAVRLALELCDGLAHAHDHGIVHGDLNPTHILLNQKAEPKIGNFGFSHPADGATTGGPTSAMDPHADIHSVGAILYQLVTGKTHTPDAAAPSSLTRNAAGLDAIWRKATHPDPSKRYADMRSFHKALAGSLETSRPATAAVAPGAANPAARPPLASFQPPVHAATSRKKAGINPGTIIQLVILASLIFATPVIWKKLEKSRDEKAQKERDERAQVARAKQQAFDDELRIAQEKSRAAKKTAPANHLPKPQAKQETPGESLERLRDSLLSGNRSEMPLGSVQQGESHYFLATKSMSWPEAASFAELHGGHLAIPSGTADLTWLVGNVAYNDAVWIGAARNGPQEWSLVDGSKWKPAKTPDGAGAFLAVDKLGFLRAAGPKQSLPFIIQWHRDGSNPGKLSALLAKTRDSLGQTSPYFPPGTLALNDRRYLFVARPISWREAVDLAETSGGHLTVVSATEEMSGISQITTDFSAADGVWLGGFNKGDQWLWITGEPWKSAKWAEDASNESPDSALILHPGKGWDSLNISALSSGFIIEWSNDRKSKPTTGNPSTEISTLATRAKDLIVTAERKRSEKLAANARKVSWDLDTYLRNLPKSDQSVWTQHVARIKNSVVNNRVLSTIPKSTGIQLSEKMAKIAQDGAIQQDKIDAAFLLEAERVRIAFITKLKESLVQAEKAGQRAVARTIDEQLDNTANLAEWLRSQDIEPKPANPTANDSGKGNESKRPAGNGNPLFE